MESINNNINVKDGIRDNFLKAIENFKFAKNSLHKIAGLDPDWFNLYLNNEKNIYDLPLEKISSVSNLSFMLSDGISSIDDDDRLKGIIDILVSKDIYNISYETLALYSNLNIDDIQKFMIDTSSLEIHKKYKLAIKSLFLLNVLKK